MFCVWYIADVCGRTHLQSTRRPVITLSNNPVRNATNGRCCVYTASSKNVRYTSLTVFVCDYHSNDGNMPRVFVCKEHFRGNGVDLKERKSIIVCTRLLDKLYCKGTSWYIADSAKRWQSSNIWERWSQTEITRNYDQVEFGDCLLPWSSEYFVFPSAIKKI
jgi:hypothetical protein